MSAARVANGPARAFVLLGVFFASSVPVYVIGRRRGLKNPWAAFVPLLGVSIVLLEATGRSGWLALLVFVPYAGALVLLLWTAVKLPAHHGRSRWWTLGLLVPSVNVLAYWFYAFTLPRNDYAFDAA
jgi:Family of unknown function (DUF5684)